MFCTWHIYPPGTFCYSQPISPFIPPPPLLLPHKLSRKTLNFLIIKEGAYLIHNGNGIRDVRHILINFVSKILNQEILIIALQKEFNIFHKTVSTRWSVNYKVYRLVLFAWKVTWNYACSSLKGYEHGIKRYIDMAMFYLRRPMCSWCYKKPIFVFCF